MWTTGLVSLSIHEALTFEGVEIAINPNACISSAPTVPKPRHQRTGSDSLVAVPSDDSKTDDKPLNSASFSTANSESNRPLEVGDMIDIRVWDPLPSTQKTAPQKRRSSPPASKDPSIIGGSASNSVAAEDLAVARRASSTSATLQAAVSTLEKSKTASSSAGSLQYSMDSSFPTVEKKEEATTIDKEGDSSTEVSSIDRAAKETIEPSASEPASPRENVPTQISAEDVVVRAGMPPTFPRNRPDTSDGNHRLTISKPPTVQRSRTTMTADATDARRRASQNPTLSKPAGVHSRDISDITTDTYANIHDVVGDPVDDVEDDDVLSRISSTHRLRFSFVMVVTEGTLTSLKESARTQVSMLRQGTYKLNLIDAFDDF